MSSVTLEPDEGPTATNDKWTVAQGEKNGRPLLIRYRNERPQGVEQSAFPFLLSATWTYQPNEFGLPSAEEMETMDKFEDALVSGLEGSRTAHLMVVLTGNGERDWLWYTRGEKQAMSQVNQSLKGHARYPGVQFSVQSDQAWQAYSQFESANGTLPRGGRIVGIVQSAFSKVLSLLGM
jgi:hypothetical protein